MRKEIAQERGADWVVMNTSAIINQTKSFTLDIGFEPFVLTPFWMKWHVTNFALPLTTFSMVTAKTYAEESRRVNNQEAITTSGIVEKLTWMIEMYDLLKDWKYFYMFHHIYIARVILAFSLTYPFAKSMSFDGASDRTVVHNFLLFIGITQTEQEKQIRQESCFTIALYENIPQFIVVILEIFQFRDSVTWIQAVNPVITVCMIYKTIGPFLGKHLYKKFAMQSPSFKDICIVGVYLVVCLIPQAFVTWMVDKNFHTQDEVPSVLFDKGLLVRQDDLDPEQVPVFIALSVIFALVAGCFYVKKKAKKVKNKDDTDEDDDEKMGM